MITLRIVKISGIGVMLLIFLSVCGVGILFGKPSRITDVDVRYNWAKSGLNIRISADINSEIIEVIPYGEKVTVLPEPTGHDFSIEITDIFSNKNSDSSSSLYLNGYWVKISYKSIEGYVFDGYLSKLPPFEYILDESGNKYVEEFESYLTRNFELKNIQEEREKNSDYHNRRILYNNGAIYEDSGNVGWYEKIMIIPNSSLREGILVFLFIAVTEEIRQLEEGEKYQIHQQNSSKLEIKIFGEDYGIYLYGSTLVFTITGSC